MAKNNEQKLYAEAMEHALEVVKREGVEGLEREVRYRNSNPLPLNVSPTELTAVARQRAQTELICVATALAMTVMYDMHFPATTSTNLLRYYNDHVDEYRYDEKKLKAAQGRMDRNIAYTKMCAEYMRESKEDEKNE